MIIDVTITALSPLAFSERKPGEQYRNSLPFVPGGALYGALGALCYSSERFADIRCRNAYPLPHEVRQFPVQARPFPVTAIMRKGQEKDIPRDALVKRVCWERQQPPALIYAPTAPDGRPWKGADRDFYILVKLGQNGRVWEGFDRDFYSLTAAEAFAKPKVPQRVLTRVAINRSTGTAEDQRLYSPLVLSEVYRGHPTVFRGTVVLPDGDETALKAFREIAQKALREITHVGGRQTSGLGRISITAEPGVAEDAAAIKARVERLTKLFQEQAKRYQALGGDAWDIPDGTIFTVNLLSDAILVEDGWLPTYTLSREMLEQATGIKARLVRAFTGATIIAGWSMLWQRPKATAPGVTMGSLFVFQADQKLSDADYKALAQLQTDGIGERRQEGYGQIRICDEFHSWRSDDNHAKPA
jgi:CRISPR-associated protein Csx10